MLICIYMSIIFIYIIYMYINKEDIYIYIYRQIILLRDEEEKMMFLFNMCTEKNDLNVIEVYEQVTGLHSAVVILMANFESQKKKKKKISNQNPERHESWKRAGSKEAKIIHNYLVLYMKRKR